MKYFLFKFWKRDPKYSLVKIKISKDMKWNSGREWRAKKRFNGTFFSKNECFMLYINMWKTFFFWVPYNRKKRTNEKKMVDYQFHYSHLSFIYIMRSPWTRPRPSGRTGLMRRGIAEDEDGGVHHFHILHLLFGSVMT